MFWAIEQSRYPRSLGPGTFSVYRRGLQTATNSYKVRCIMKRTTKNRGRRSRYLRVISRLLPGQPLYTIETEDVVADLDPGLLMWRAR